MGKKKSVAEGRFQVPPHWPPWKLRCKAHKRRSTEQCSRWAIVGMPTCKYHGSGGEVNARIGRIRYLCWVITGGPKDMPVSAACEVALAVFAEAVLKRSEGSVAQQMKAAMWITELL